MASGVQAQTAQLRSLGQAATYDVFANGPLTMGSQTIDRPRRAAGDMSLASMEIGQRHRPRATTVVVGRPTSRDQRLASTVAWRRSSIATASAV